MTAYPYKSDIPSLRKQTSSYGLSILPYKLMQNKLKLDQYFDPVERRCLGCLIQLITWAAQQKGLQEKELVQIGKAMLESKKLQNSKQLQNISTCLAAAALYLILSYHQQDFFREALLKLSDGRYTEEKIVLREGISLVQRLVVREDEEGWEQIIRSSVKNCSDRAQVIEKSKQYLLNFEKRKTSFFGFFSKFTDKPSDTKDNSFLFAFAKNLQDPNEIKFDSDYPQTNLLARLIHAAIHGIKSNHVDQINHLKNWELLQVGFRLMREQRVEQKEEQLRVKVVQRKARIHVDLKEERRLKQVEVDLKLFGIQQPIYLLNFQKLKSKFRESLTRKLSDSERVAYNSAYYRIYTTSFSIPMHQAVIALNQNKIKQLKKLSRFQKMQLVENNSLLYFAVRAGFYDNVKWMIQQLKCIDHPYESNNPVNCASYFGFLDILQLLKKHRFDFKKPNTNGILAVDEAKTLQVREFVKKSMDKQANQWIDYPQVKLVINLKRRKHEGLKIDSQTSSFFYKMGRIDKTVYYKFIQVGTFIKLFNKQEFNISIYNTFEAAYVDLFKRYQEFQETNRYICLALLSLSPHYRDITSIKSNYLDLSGVFVVRHTEVVYMKDKLLSFVNENIKY